jgi:hypothetical protein
MMGDIHSKTNLLLIDTYIEELAEREYLFKTVKTIPCIKHQANWDMCWIADKKSTSAERLVVFAVVEGIFFSGLFASIFWLKRHDLMSGLTFSDELRQPAPHSRSARRNSSICTETVCPHAVDPTVQLSNSGGGHHLSTSWAI